MIKYNLKDYDKNIFCEFKDNFALITAGGKNGYNPMTVSWGGMGELWNKRIVILFVRPQRYTMKFIEENDKLTLSFFGGLYKDNLTKAGRISGRGINKYKEIGLTPVYDVDADIYYAKEASYVFKLTKLYVDDIKQECLIDKSIDLNIYPDKDYHKMIICQIDTFLVNEEYENR